ncbi:MAG: M20 family peptidase [Coriobacteriales bacterium]|jgi:carboxypeptidase PM20D1|nr:M20 family peptidase [Coriobacteriales bacterium]
MNLPFFLLVAICVLGVFSVLVIFVAILLVRAFNFKPPITKKPVISEAVIDSDKVTDSLAQMVRCKTVSSDNPALVDETEFTRFHQVIETLFPTVHQVCPPEHVGASGLLFSLKGENSASPVVLMSHYDVVPADEEAWEKPAFAGIIEDGVLWGRGTLDTKITLNGVLSAAEMLLAQGFVPKNDMYFAFSGDEEIAGPSAPEMVELLQQRGVSPGLVIDEGGAVVEDIFPGVKQPCAVIGIAEKGMLDVELSIESQGGHASAPPPHTLVGQLSQAVVRIENRPFPNKLTKPVAEMFDTLGRYSTFAYRLLFANLWCFMPVLDLICRKTGGELNAMMRTTCAFTMMEGGKATNVLPPSAKMRANLRLIGGETPESAVEYLKSVAKNPDIKFNILYGMNPSIDSRTDGSYWEILKGVIAETWPKTLVSPYLMVAASDSRHYCRISDGVYRFSAVAVSKSERNTIHGHNERVPVEKIVKNVQFYLRLMRQC